MGRATPQSHAKRQREQLKKDKRRAKEEKRAARKAEKITDESEPQLPEQAEAFAPGNTQ
jgi:hypothetical protein